MCGHIELTLRYLKMAVTQLVPETKKVDVGKLISLRNLLVRKVIRFVLATTSATLILSRSFGADWMTRIAYIYSRLPKTHSFSPFQLQRQNTLSFSYILTSNSQSHENVCILQHFLSCSAFLVRVLPASNTTSEIWSNPESDKERA